MLLAPVLLHRLALLSPILQRYDHTGIPVQLNHAGWYSNYGMSLKHGPHHGVLVCGAACAVQVV